MKRIAFVLLLRRSFLLLLLVFAVPVFAQDTVEHAPTVEQCRADQRLWLSKLEQAPLEPLPEPLPTFKVLNVWVKEMYDCQPVDPTNEAKYYNTFTVIVTRQTNRLVDFLKRHNQWDEFIQEDAAGKR